MSESDTASETDQILHIDKVHNMLSSLSEKQLNSLVPLTSFIGTSDGPIKIDSMDDLLQKCTIVLGQDRGYYLFHKYATLIHYDYIC